MAKIREHIKIHDKFQFEIKFDYELSKFKKTTDYSVDSYFFVPNSLGINSFSYSKGLFYRDIQTYIRLLPPSNNLEKMIQDTGENILTGIEHSIQECGVGTSVDPATCERIIIQLKTFCNTFRDAARENLNMLVDNKSNKEIGLRTEIFLHSMRKILMSYRARQPLFNQPSLPLDLRNTYQYGDEYLSYLFEKYSFLVLDALKKQNEPLFLSFQPLFIKEIKSEIAYRDQKGYASDPDSDPSSEEVLYRHGVLKRFFESSLFIQTRMKEQGGLVLQIVYGLAAGLAMVFATVIAFFAQRRFGNFTFPLFTALVVSYIFKDRLKDVSRNWIYSRWSRKGFDHKTVFSIEKKQTGYCKEHFTFIPEAQLDSAVTELRRRKRMTPVENNLRQEQVFRYRKHVRIYSKVIRENFTENTPAGVTDITRFNVQKFIRKMDDPQKSYFVLDGDSFTKREGSKVYHLNLVMRYASSKQVVYKRSRIIFNRSGIKEIQAVD